MARWTTSLLVLLLAGTAQAAPLFVPADRIASLKTAAARGTSEWKALKAHVDKDVDKPGLGEAGIMNVAVAYLASGDRRYCDRLGAEARPMMTASNPRHDSYYDYAALMGDAAAILTFCGPLLDAGVANDLGDYLDRWTHELWFDNQGSGWGLKDPGNNYHISFLLGTAYAAIGLQAVNHPNAKKYLDMANRGIDEELAYVAARTPGGGWIEGTNYGGGSKGRIADFLSVIAAAGGRNAFRESPFFPALLLYAHQQLQPGNKYLYPAGDMARESNMTVSSYDRSYVQTTVYWLPDSDARRLGQWYLTHVAPNYRTSFGWTSALWRELVYKLDLPETPQSSLPLGFVAKGDNFIAFRSGWDEHATAFMLSGASQLDQSHDHLDTGGFTLWHDGWQAVDAVTYSHSGLLWDPGSHNLVSVAGVKNGDRNPKGIIHLADDGKTGYVALDATGLYSDGQKPLMTEVTRELVYLRPSTVVLYDRVAPTAPTTTWRLHFPARPEVNGQTVTARNEAGGITVALLTGETMTVKGDSDLISDPEGSRAFRVEAPSSGRTLAVLRVGSGAPPALDASRIAAGDMEGALVGNDLVLFSKKPLGQPVTSFTYSVPSRPGRTHTLVDLRAAIGLTVEKAGGTTTVTVGPGSDKTASPEGVVSFTE